MEVSLALSSLAANADAIAALARDIAEAQARWKPAPDDWSILEVICHLYDEEREDFRQRVDYILHRPEDAWPPIDPEGWVAARAYNERDPGTALADFLREREASLTWLRSLSNPKWAQTRLHPQIGPVRADEMLAAWVAHDHLHIRQLNELHWKYLATLVTPFSLDYAGGW